MSIRSRLWCIGLPLLSLMYVLSPVSAPAQMTSVGIDCSQVDELQLFKQENMRAGLALIECGFVPGGQPSGIQDLPLVPANILASKRKCSDQFNCTRSESMAAGNTTGTNIVVNYNDHNKVPVENYSGVSFSTNSGATFTEILPPPFNSAHGENFGDPIVVFNKKLGKFFAGDLATG